LEVKPPLRCLLVNPWIYDFAAFDLWIKPLGLLYLGAVLRDQGWHIDILDCMDRFHPRIGKPKNKKYFTGKYIKQNITKPPVLSDINRHYGRYGLPVSVVKEQLQAISIPDVILLTSGMLYWYPSVKKMITVLREAYEDVPIILGGIYATLAEEHARKNCTADYVLTGEAENRLPAFLRNTLGFDFNVHTYDSLDDLPYPAYDAYESLRFLPLLTSRGCPLKCTFCASHIISGKYRMRSVESVVDEVVYAHKKYKIDNVVFYDDALLHRKEKHLLPILENFLARDLSLKFHTPNGLHTEKIDKDTASLMVRSGFTTIRLSLETISEDRNRDISGKVTAEGFTKAVNNLRSTGFLQNNIEAYILMGLPGQSVEEVVDTLFFTAGQGVITKLAAYSPIPGTVDWGRAVASGDLREDVDLLETNNTVQYS